ncbi:MAG: ferritin [Corynebacterium sp.]|nr:ferritin [Corynebacterium sp.]
MKLTEKLNEAFNKQVTAEFEAAMIYRQLSYVFDDMSLTGMRDWMAAHADEELGHAADFSKHMLDRDALPQIGTIEAPGLKIDTPVQAFEAALAHEQKVSAMIRELSELAAAEGDSFARPFLDRYLDEQIEEEASVSEILDRLRMVEGDGSGILRMDAELGAAE